LRLKWAVNHRGTIGQGGGAPTSRLVRLLLPGMGTTAQSGEVARGADPIFALSGINAGRHWFRLYARNSPTRAEEKEYAIESRIMDTDKSPDDSGSRAKRRTLTAL